MKWKLNVTTTYQLNHSYIVAVINITIIQYYFVPFN